MGRRRQSHVDCKTVVRELSNYIDGRVDRKLRDRIEAHLTVCGECATLNKTMRQMLDMLGDENSLLRAIEKHGKTSNRTPRPENEDSPDDS